VNLQAGGSEGSDDSLHVERPGNRGDADSLSASENHGGLGGASVKKEEQAKKGAIRVRYTERSGKSTLVRCVVADPFDVLEWVFKRMDAEA
jgi:hypothetical protein